MKITLQKTMEEATFGVRVLASIKTEFDLALQAAKIMSAFVSDCEHTSLANTTVRNYLQVWNNFARSIASTLSGYLAACNVERILE